MALDENNLTQSQAKEQSRKILEANSKKDQIEIWNSEQWLKLLKDNELIV